MCDEANTTCRMKFWQDDDCPGCRLSHISLPDTVTMISCDRHIAPSIRYFLCAKKLVKLVMGKIRDTLYSGGIFSSKSIFTLNKPPIILNHLLYTNARIGIIPTINNACIVFMK